MSRNLTILCLVVSGVLLLASGLWTVFETFWTGGIRYFPGHGPGKFVDASSLMFYFEIVLRIAFSAIGVPLVYVAYRAWKIRPRN